MTKGQDQPRRALGKGLSALLPRKAPPAPAPSAPPQPAAHVTELPIAEIQPNPLQPRRIFAPDRLEGLAQSVRANGIIQPLVVRQTANSYQLVAGERRWRAAKLAGLETVPVVVQGVPDDRLLEITLIENIQREDLNPIEVAQAFDRLVRELHLSHEELGRRTGKDRTTITNLLRLLRLPPAVQQLVADHRLSMGHARAILGLPDLQLQTEVAEKAAAESLSVRQVERLVHKMTEPRDPKIPEPPNDPNVKAAVSEMENVLGTRVRIVEKGPARGRIEIEYYSLEELDRLYSLLVGEKRATA
jgi:ParB family transcriptional regulator, chromosome partitioning protein